MRKATQIAVAMWGCAGLDCNAAAAAEELAMPFTCAIERGAPKLYPGAETRFKILGKRDEQPFVACGSASAGRCETMMVHRFAIDCDGIRTPWASIAQAGRGVGAALPANLPNGFAPVSGLAGRFVLPSLTGADEVGGVIRVAMQDLSPDSVIDGVDPVHERPHSDWTTTVSSDSAVSAGGEAFRVAAWVALLILAMVGASIIVAGRWRFAALSALDMRGSPDTMRGRALDWARDAYGAIDRRLREIHVSWFADEGDPADHALFNASLMTHAKLAQAELALSALPPGLLLRDVLEAEVAKARQRAVDADRRIRSRAPQQSAAAFRALGRDLDRIVRIARDAAAPKQNDADDSDAPHSPAEAYRILGLNADAPPLAAKKLVDALRMNWHPDHARDEPDRLRREARMKQINAAWDLIRERQAA